MVSLELKIQNSWEYETTQTVIPQPFEWWKLSLTNWRAVQVKKWIIFIQCGTMSHAFLEQVNNCLNKFYLKWRKWNEFWMNVLNKYGSVCVFVFLQIKNYCIFTQSHKYYFNVYIFCLTYIFNVCKREVCSLNNMEQYIHSIHLL